LVRVVLVCAFMFWPGWGDSFDGICWNRHWIRNSQDFEFCKFCDCHFKITGCVLFGELFRFMDKMVQNCKKVCQFV
jgi:hypothetical protein